MSQEEKIEKLMEVAKKEITRLNSYVNSGSSSAKIAVKEWKVYLLILNALVNQKSKKGIFAILLAKYDEVVSDGMEIREKFVKENKLDEVAYLTYCKNIVVMRDNAIRMVNRRIAADEEEGFYLCMLSQ